MSAPRCSIALTGATAKVPGQHHTFQVGEIALGRVAAKWRKVKIISMEKTKIDGVECTGITAAWVVPTSNVTVNTFRKEFVPEMYQDLLPCTAEYCKIYNVSD